MDVSLPSTLAGIPIDADPMQSEEAALLGPQQGAPDVGGSPEDDGAGASRKRAPITRISTACNACRTRKYRCNGETPCSNCIRSRIACIFTPNKRTKRSRPEE
jgi:hypothetical protein